MNKRDLAITALFNRIKAAKTTLGLVCCKVTPTKSLESYSLPAVFLVEGVDRLLTTASRNPLGYPATREVEIICELVFPKSINIRQKYRDVRNVVLSSHILVEDTSVKEIRAEGPTGYGLPDVVGMRLVLGLIYPDDGT